jgi:hypothetical protein
MKRALTIWLSLIIFVWPAILPALLAVNLAQASDAVNFAPQVSIPGSEFQSQQDILVKNDTSLICDYIVAIYKYAIAIVGIIAVLAVAIGGVMWIVAAGNSGRISEGKEWIISGLLGLLLALGSFMILSTINKDLVTCQIKSIPVVGRQKDAAKTPGIGFGENFGLQGQRCQEPSESLDSSGQNWCCVIYGELDGSGLVWDDAFKRCATLETADKTKAQNRCNAFYSSLSISKADRSGMAQGSAIIHTSPLSGLAFGPLAVPAMIAIAFYGEDKINDSANATLQLETREEAAAPANPDNQQKNTAAVYQGRCWEIPQIKKWCQGSECPNYCRDKGDGYSCVIPDTNTWGYCQNGSCQKCKIHCQSCNHNYECPNQLKDPVKNGLAGVICGEEIFSFWGSGSNDCASGQCDYEVDDCSTYCSGKNNGYPCAIPGTNTIGQCQNGTCLQ